jgi:hypothetical protein
VPARGASHGPGDLLDNLDGREIQAMTRKTHFITALVGAALASSVATYAHAGTHHRGEWQTLQTGNKLSVQVYREIPEQPHALTGTLERAERTEVCRRELRQGGNKLTTIGYTCTTR